MAEQMAELNKSAEGAYSDKETIIGTWSDTGKTCYMKTISGTIPANAVTADTAYDYFEDNNIYIKEVIGGNVSTRLLPNFTTANNYLTTTISDHKLTMYTSAPAWVNSKSWYCTIVYTKS